MTATFKLNSLQLHSLEISFQKQTYQGIAADLRDLVHFTVRVSLCTDLGPTARPSRMPMITSRSQHPPRRINCRAICRLKVEAFYTSVLILGAGFGKLHVNEKHIKYTCY
jgi:hypothetical protein